MDTAWASRKKFTLFASTCFIFLALFLFQNARQQDDGSSVVLVSEISVSARTQEELFNLGSSNLEKFSSKTHIKYRLQFSHEGKCIGVSTDGDLQVTFCDPNSNQAFYFPNGILIADETSLCIGLKDSISTELAMVECKEALKFELMEGALRYESGSEMNLCVSSLSDGKPTLSPALGAALALTNCNNRLSQINFLEETDFLVDRRALLTLSPNGKKDVCNRAASVRPAMAQLLPDSQINRCQNLSECVTVVVKTARRPQLVIRLAESIQSVLHQDLPMIVIDDGPLPHPPETLALISKYPNINYLVANETDLGISEGRMLGVNMVKTKYFVNMDDDNVVTKSWDAAKLAELLDKTDLSLVGVRTDSLNWPGFLDFNCDGEKPVLLQSMKSCRIANQTLPSFPECVRCDLSSNSFMAKTEDVLEVGGWSKELKVFEHHDLFLRLKGGGKKVMWCPSFRVLNVHTSSGEASVDKDYKRLRYVRGLRMRRLFLNRWNIFKHRTVSEESWSLSWLHDL